jgi:hypothetical protein
VSLFDPNTGSEAEDQMERAFGCVVVTVIGFAAAVIIGIVLLVRAVL